MSEQLKLDVGQAVEIRDMARRERGSDGSEWTNEKLKMLCERKGLFGQLLDVLECRAEIVLKKIEDKVAKSIPAWLRAKVGRISREKLVADLDNVAVGNTGLTFRISDYAKDLTSKTECIISVTSEEVEFAIATPEDLGFKKEPTTDEFFDEKDLAKYGLELCKSDDPHSLRKSYLDQPDGEWLPIAMKPIRDSDGGLNVFSLKRHGSELWLSGYYVYPQSRWSLGYRLVFRVRKNQN